jgi:hypothetical protein
MGPPKPDPTVSYASVTQSIIAAVDARLQDHSHHLIVENDLGRCRKGQS